ncbi:HEAT repeat domain-containing protein [Myxococcus xanthus]|uniref:HEAT repeat domain-containing protein n=2 Tax=Myxococcus xanthus TaxID=34 RepID=UPI001F3B3C93|nr:HEAT repeat domain-containing protein [Myxococcus xanthus]
MTARASSPPWAPRSGASDGAPKEALFALVDDARPVVREKAIRVLARCDQGEGLPTLLRCLEDERVLSLLSRVPLTRVRGAKEVVRLLGELRSDAAYERLIALDGTRLHRDVRIALLRALWAHLEREPTWAIFARAVEGEEWVMAARLGDIPADRLGRRWPGPRSRSARAADAWPLAHSGTRQSPFAHRGRCDR